MIDMMTVIHYHLVESLGGDNIVKRHIRSAGYYASPPISKDKIVGVSFFIGLSI
jgi:hypothetical protein